MPAALRHAMLDECHECRIFLGLLASVAPLIAGQTPRGNVGGIVPSPVLPGSDVFGRALISPRLTRRQAMANREGVEVGLPHGMLAIEAKALLAYEGLGAEARE
jgi:hypothetical protein